MASRDVPISQLKERKEEIEVIVGPDIFKNVPNDEKNSWIVKRIALHFLSMMIDLKIPRQHITLLLMSILSLSKATVNRFLSYVPKSMSVPIAEGKSRRGGKRKLF